MWQQPLPPPKKNTVSTQVLKNAQPNVQLFQVPLISPFPLILEGKKLRLTPGVG